MPLYTDSNYYYSGGSSQLYSPYTPTSTSVYSPYSSSYNRSIGGSYVVPVSTPRTSSNYATHNLSSRYQPKLTTITETSPLISAARHTSYMPLTRIQSPKCYTGPSYSHSHSSAVHTPKYIPPRPILINTADIDVSANRYRKRKEETLRQVQRESGYNSPTSSISRRNSLERRVVEEEEDERKKNNLKPKQDLETSQDSKPDSVIKDIDTNQSAEPKRNRSTIKRNRAVVRLSTIRSRSKERNKPKQEDLSSPEPEKKLKDAEEPLKWRQKLADELASIPSYPNKKSPGDMLREKYLIQDATDDENYAAQCRAERLSAGLPKETIEQVMIELDPLHHTVSRLSIPQCPTFHDICEDISSDKIDDDLNAGELRKKASLIQSQEQELLNQLQKSASGTFQMITLERRGSHDSVEELPLKRHSKRISKKGKKVRTKITAIVGIENAPALASISQEKEEEFDPGKSPKPKFTINVESVEEHHKIDKVVKLPKKKSIKKTLKVSEKDLPDGFMSSLPKPQISPKKKLVPMKDNEKTTGEIFTFDDITVKEAKEQQENIQEESSLPLSKIENHTENTDKMLKFPLQENDVKKIDLVKTFDKTISVEPKTNTSPTTIGEESKSLKAVEKSKETLKFPTQIRNAKISTLAKTLEKSDQQKMEELTTLENSEDYKSTPQLLKTGPSIEDGAKPSLSKTLEKSNSITIDLKTPVTPKSTAEAASASKPTVLELTKAPEIKPSLKTLKTSQSLDSGSKPHLAKTLEKTNSLTVELKTPPVIKKPLFEDITKKEETKFSTTKNLKTSQSLDDEVKTNLVKTLEKSNSLTIELKTPTTATNTIKDESDASSNLSTEEPKLATPKPIRKAIKKSDSGEDFWAQIGTRETFYMNKRKHDLVETQWQKRENLLESTTDKEVKNLEEIKTMVTSQKIEALKKADQEQKSSKGVISRSNSNESAMKKKTPKKAKQDSETKEEKTKKKVSPIKKKKTPTKTEESPKDFAMAAIVKTNDKLENLKTPENTKISQESSSSTPVTMANAKTFSTTTPPKIIGQSAKSPEQQEQAEQNKYFPTILKARNNNKNEIDINKETTTKTKENEQQQQLAKTFTLPAENDKLTMAKAATTTSTTNKAEATTTKQPETQSITKTSTDTNNIKNNAVEKTPKTTDSENKTITTKKPQNEKKSPAKTKVKTSPNVLNADQFVAKAPNKTNTSPVKAITKTMTSPPATKAQAKANNAAAPTKKTADDSKKTTNATSTYQTINATTAAATTTTDAKTNNNEIRNNIKDSNNKNNDDVDSNNETRGGNLSKFATVSNLAQCLQDVDADLADYIPSSAENSENDDNYNSDSDFDYSSIDGWEKLTPSMKKKVKQRRRKEKQAEQARFDPQKKVKIDATRKLYVKEEAPRFPLVATPRPLWKREKIVYPDEDSDDESDSEETGSNEETEDSDECTTSEEFEDELHPTASGAGSGGDSVVKISDQNKENSSIIRMSTCSNDSGFEGGTAPSSPKKMLECDVNCHKKCARLTANLCGVNQKLLVEALANVKRGARETRDSPSTPPSLNPVYEIEANEEEDETSYTYSQFQKSGRFTPPATIIPRFKNYTVDDFHFLTVLGKGSFGKVLLAELRDTTYYYAVKCLKKDVVLEDDDVDSTLIERKVLALGTKHPYLCHLFCTFQTESHLFFVMEYLNGGDLMFHIQESGRFTEERARFYGAEIISGLKFLHKKGIIYRDLKLDNVLLDYEGHVRIADFGMCKLQIYLDKTADSFCGTPDYMAPEIIKGDNYNQNVDWWSFGVLLYEMLIGQSPFSGCDEDELFWSICNELPWFPVYISAEATGILKGLLEKDYTKRIGSQYSPAGDVVEHIFFRPIDWNLLEKRQIEPPFRPQVKHPLDTQYFDRVFTRERVRLTPIDKDILQSMDQKQFLGFTYTNPHITLD